MGRGGGSRAAGAIAHMEMGEVFKTAGFRRARGRARGSCGDADRDDARRAVEGVADGLVPERHEGARGDLQPVRRQPGGPRLPRKFGVRHDGLERRHRRPAGRVVAGRRALELSV